MDRTQVIIFAVAMGFLGVRLYQKYIKKDKGKTATGSNPKQDSAFPSSSKDDDYEPYSGK
jgi:uncharacterized membrane protein YebE (DUF533 family)